MYDMKFSQEWLWKVPASGIQHHVAHCKSTNILYEHVTPIIRDEE
jgi:hypothetical protein